MGPRIFYIIFLILFVKVSFQQITFETNSKNHQPLLIDDSKLSIVHNLSNLQNFETILDNILIPRVVSTPGHETVKTYIVNFLQKLSWSVDLDSFEAQTPNMGILPFENIIATHNKNAVRHLVFACHYDSKYFPNEEFLGATDSAVPCAMMLNLAFVLKDYLNIALQNNDLGLRFVFFDGEEAFQQWGPNDSIYGAKHLADKWEKEGVLLKTDLIILLDLLGAPDPVFYSFFENTEPWYRGLLNSEDRLARSGFLGRYSYSTVSVQQSTNRYFQPRSTRSFIEDDHVPFLQRGVPILHVIPIPFPDVWHQMSDNRAAIDRTTVENLLKIFKVFILEYLHIPI